MPEDPADSESNVVSIQNEGINHFRIIFKHFYVQLAEHYHARMGTPCGPRPGSSGLVRAGVLAACGPHADLVWARPGSSGFVLAVVLHMRSHQTGFHACAAAFTRACLQKAKVPRIYC